MPKAYPVRQAFNSGEISELCAFRDDIAKYNSACLTLENLVPLVEGGAKKMPGTYFAGTTALGGSMFTGSIAGTTLTVTAVNFGVLRAGQVLSGAGISPGTVIQTVPVIDTFTASISGNTLTVTGIAANIGVGQVISGTGVAAGTVIISLGTGIGGAGTYIVNIPQAISSEAMTSSFQFGTTGTYTVNHSQTVSSETMQTASSGKSRLVPFQFSTEQGAILELSAGIVRIWEGASLGSWSLGLAVNIPGGANPYNPATAYVSPNVVQVGPFWMLFSDNGTPAGKLYISAPYGASIPSSLAITISVNASDALSVTVTGSYPNQGINIALANTTAAHNAASAIQTAIIALGSLNSVNNNYVDLSQWTVTPDTVYYATPWITVPPSGQLYNLFGNAPQLVECVASNQFDQFPLTFKFIVTRWRVVVNSSYWERYAFPGVQVPIELATPYADADLFALDCSTQSVDVLWIFHPNYPPAVIERLGANSWQYSAGLPGQQTNEPAYRGTTAVVKTGYSALGQCITAITKANPCVVTVSATTQVFIQGDRIYINLVAGMVEVNQGEYLVDNPTDNGDGTWSFALQDPDTGADVDSSGYLAYTSGGFAVEVVPMFAASGDYPACGTLYQERLTVGGSLNNPAQINGSVQDDYPDFICDPNEDDYAIQFTLVSNKLDQILNMIGTPNSLVIGTAGGVWIMAGANGESLSQTNVTASKQSSLGVSPLQPQLVNDSAIFISRSTRIVTFLVYNFVSNQWDAYDLTRLNRNITLGTTAATSGIAQTSFQMEPYPIFWAIRNDGQLLGLVFNKQDQVYAWFRINMQNYGGNVESVSVISGANQEDQVAVVVNRTVNGVTVRYVEYFMQQELFHQLSNAFCVNCGQQWQGLSNIAISGINNGNPCTITTLFPHGLSGTVNVFIAGAQGMTQVNNTDPTNAYTAAASGPNTLYLVGVDSTSWGVYTGGGVITQVTNQVSGLSYLIGQQVEAVGDGALILQPTVVTADTVFLPYYANLITIGIPYQVTLRPTNPVLSSQAATTRGMKQKLNRVTISLYESMGGQYGTDLAHMHDIDYGPGTMAKQPQMSTLEITRDMDADWEESATFYITQNEPFPFTVRGLVWRDSANQD